MRRRLVAVAALAVALSCHPDAETPDADLADAGPDSAGGSGRDVGADAADGQVVRDAGPGGWVSIADGLPSFCRLLRADHPEQLDELRIHMSPCPGRSNCELSDALPLPSGQRPDWLAADGSMALGMLADYLGDTWFFVAPLDGGPPMAAYRSDAGSNPALWCGLGFGALAEGRVAMVVEYNDGASMHGAAVYVAPLAEAGRIERPLIDDRRTFSTLFPQGVWVGSTAVVVWTPGGGLFDVSTGSVVFLPVRTPASLGTPPSVFGAHALWAAYGDTQHIELGHAGVLGGVNYYEPAPGNEVEVARSDGHDVAWIEGVVGSTASDFVLWTAPFVEDPAMLAPRAVRHIPIWTDPAVGAGVWADAAGPPIRPRYQMELYDLTDGRQRTWDETDIVDVGILHLAEDLVVYKTPTPDTGRHLVRFDPRLVPYDTPTADAGVDAGP